MLELSASEDQVARLRLIRSDNIGPVTYFQLLARFDLVLLYLAFGLLIAWKHRGNIERLLAGTEPKVGRPKDA